MCGIVGYSGSRSAKNIILKGLKRLEYRGYDSAGIALGFSDRIEVRRAEGKLLNVEKVIESELATLEQSQSGIGHTRWATHGAPTTQNAHPHRVGHVVLVHNGIIENYQEIRERILKSGRKPQSETDSELFGFLVLDEMEKGHSLQEAVRRAFEGVEGRCSMVVMSDREPGVVVGIRDGSPLVAALDPQGGAFFASDAQPLAEYVGEVVYLENGDLAVGTRSGLRIFDRKTGQAVNRSASKLDWSPERLEKGGYSHFMLKEIHEQPAALVDTLNALVDRKEALAPFQLVQGKASELLEKAREIVFVACGTSFHSAMVGKYWIEGFARVPVHLELASEFRYRKPVLAPGTLVVGITQSGETADTLAVLKDAKQAGFATLGITNVRGSTVSREADAVLYTAAGPEVGVAATKTFTAQLVTLITLAGFLAAQSSELSREARESLFLQLIRVPHLMTDFLQENSGLGSSVRNAAVALQNSKGFFFIGRGTSYPIALEAALKLKEISYIPAEGYAAGELKHGPIAMIDNQMAVVVLAPRDSWRDKTVSNLEEVKARGARIIGVGHESDRRLQELCDLWIPIPELKMGNESIDESLIPFFVTPVIQLLSFELALLKGTDIDQPRNLAKSVTVE